MALDYVPTVPCNGVVGVARLVANYPLLTVRNPVNASQRPAKKKLR